MSRIVRWVWINGAWKLQLSSSWCTWLVGLAPYYCADWNPTVESNYSVLSTCLNAVALLLYSFYAISTLILEGNILFIKIKLLHLARAKCQWTAHNSKSRLQMLRQDIMRRILCHWAPGYKYILFVLQSFSRFFFSGSSINSQTAFLFHHAAQLCLWWLSWYFATQIPRVLMQ